MTTDTDADMQRLISKFKQAGLQVVPCPGDYLPGDEDAPLGYRVSATDLITARGAVVQLVGGYGFEYESFYDNRDQEPDGYITLVSHGAPTTADRTKKNPGLEVTMTSAGARLNAYRPTRGRTASASGRS